MQGHGGCQLGVCERHALPEAGLCGAGGQQQGVQGQCVCLGPFLAKHVGQQAQLSFALFSLLLTCGGELFGLPARLLSMCGPHASYLCLWIHWLLFGQLQQSQVQSKPILPIFISVPRGKYSLTYECSSFQVRKNSGQSQ